MNEKGKIRILVAGCGAMGRSHSLAYHKMEGFEIVGLVSRSPHSREALNEYLGGGYPLFDDYVKALDSADPDAVSINTLTDTHYAFAMAALDRGCHVFLEKPLATTAEEAEEIVKKARSAGKKLLVGYILQHHPAWHEFVSRAGDLGKPLVMRMNLNQQSSAEVWEKHKRKLRTLSPLVDCGVHYVEVMCRMAGASPLSVSAVGARLSGDIPENISNYGHLQLTFPDGSVGWYEAGWGPMMSRNAFFIKDVTGPGGSVSMTATQGNDRMDPGKLENHTKTEQLVIHGSELDESGNFRTADRIIEFAGNRMPGHDDLCFLEQAFFLKAIKENLDLSDHHKSAVDSLKIVLAAEESIRTGRTVEIIK